MKIREIMSTNLGLCGPQTNAAQIAEILWSRDCGALPVVDERNKLIGIVTDRDLTIALGTRNRRASSVTADEVMTKDVATCRPDEDVKQALLVMKARKVRRIPIVDYDWTLRGIVSIYDIVHAAAKNGSEIPVKMILEALTRIEDKNAPKERLAVAAGR